MSKLYDNPIMNDAVEIKDYNIKNILNKSGGELFNEDRDVVEKVVRVKRVQMPNRGEKWKVSVDNKVMFTLDGSKVSKKEKEFLRTPEGFNFLLNEFKNGIKSLNSFKNELKKRLRTNE